MENDLATKKKKTSFAKNFQHDSFHPAQVLINIQKQKETAFNVTTSRWQDTKMFTNSLKQKNKKKKAEKVL